MSVTVAGHLQKNVLPVCLLQLSSLDLICTMKCPLSKVPVRRASMVHFYSNFFFHFCFLVIEEAAVALLRRFLKEKGGSPHTAMKICMVGNFSCFFRFSDTFVNFLKDNVITVNSQKCLLSGLNGKKGGVTGSLSY